MIISRNNCEYLVMFAVILPSHNTTTFIYNNYIFKNILSEFLKFSLRGIHYCQMKFHPFRVNEKNSQRVSRSTEADSTRPAERKSRYLRHDVAEKRRTFAINLTRRAFQFHYADLALRTRSANSLWISTRVRGRICFSIVDVVSFH